MAPTVLKAVVVTHPSVTLVNSTARLECLKHEVEPLYTPHTSLTLRVSFSENQFEADQLMRQVFWQLSSFDCKCYTIELFVPNWTDRPSSHVAPKSEKQRSI